MIRRALDSMTAAAVYTIVWLAIWSLGQHPVALVALAIGVVWVLVLLARTYPQRHTVELVSYRHPGGDR